MLKSLKIENFRCFQSFELQQLGRLNLLVGTNNSGKTSILEAIQLLLTPSLNFEILGDVMIGRSEYVENEEYHTQDLVIRHLYYSHKIDVGSKISFFGLSDIDTQEKLTLSIENRKTNGDSESPMLCIKRKEFEIPFLLTKEGNVSLKLLQDARKSLIEQTSHIQLVNSSSLTTEKAIELFDLLVLTPEEELVTQSLKTIEPHIERIATVSSGKNRYEGIRSGFIVKLSDVEQRTPIGSMGDGMWRMLGLTLAIVNARNGVLLVDEIDTGFHFSAMSKMWKMIWETAKRLNVQVFATTHNSDCWTSLAAIASAENPSEEGITIQRIEKGKSNSVVFTERQVAIAAERGIEVR
jgi:AAA15 family ATPase/GTPase